MIKIILTLIIVMAGNKPPVVQQDEAPSLEECLDAVQKFLSQDLEAARRNIPGIEGFAAGCSIRAVGPVGDPA